MSIIGLPKFAGALVVALTVRDAAAAADFYVRAFGAEEIARYVVPRAPNGTNPIKQVHLKIGDAAVQICADAAHTPSGTPEGISSVLSLYVADVDAALTRACAAGAVLLSPPQNSLWGDRIAIVRDPFGHVWGLAGVLEEISIEEHNRRWAAATKQGDPPRLERIASPR